MLALALEKHPVPEAQLLLAPGHDEVAARGAAASERGHVRALAELGRGHLVDRSVLHAERDVPHALQR